MIRLHGRETIARGGSRSAGGRSVARRLAMTAALALTMYGALAQDTSHPRALIETSAQKMLQELEANRAEYRKDPKKVDKLVDELLLPNFDTAYAAEKVLGTHWKTATPEQRQRFINAFYRSLLAKYGAALVKFEAGQLKVMPFRGDVNKGSATIQTRVKTSDGTVVPVDYLMRKTPQGWKAYDVKVEGISYVTTFRNDFNTEINRNGLEAVIQRIEKGGAGKAAAQASDDSAKAAKPGT